MKIKYKYTAHLAPAFDEIIIHFYKSIGTSGNFDIVPKDSIYINMGELAKFREKNYDNDSYLVVSPLVLSSAKTYSEAAQEIIKVMFIGKN